MSVINQETFCAIVTSPNAAGRRDLSYQLAYILRQSRDSFTLPVDRESALALLEQVKSTVARRGCLGDKYLRPHEFDDFSYLDRSQPWWGFEFETGWQSAEARTAAIEAAWDIGVNGVTFDAEGEGYHECEITFAPSPMSEVLDGTSPASKFVQYMNDHQSDVYKSGDAFVGTHINISFPTVLGTYAESVMNNTLALLPIGASFGNVRKELFGRAGLYNGFFTRTSRGQSWLEGKLFRTAYDIEQFNKYVGVGHLFTRIGQLVVDNPVLNRRDVGVTNLLEMYENPNVEPVFMRNDSWSGTTLRSWIDGEVIANNQPYSERYYDINYDPNTTSEVVSLS